MHAAALQAAAEPPSAELVRLPWPGADIAAAAAALARDGAVVIERALDPRKCEAVRAEMAPYVAEAAEEQWLLLDSEGKPSTSAGACASGCVLARSPASWDFAQHPLILELCEGVLGRQVLTKSADALAEQFHPDRGFAQHPFTLDLSGLICIGAGGAAQKLHQDGGIHIPDLRRLTGIEARLSTVWALSPFTEARAATTLVLGSHRWGRERRPERGECVCAEMAVGSVLLFTGALWHGAGENQAPVEDRIGGPNTRFGLNIDYTLGWLRQEENQYIAVPLEVARSMPDSLLSLIGYEAASGGLGWFDNGKSPMALVADGGRGAKRPINWAAPRL